jgi:CubicO group peptidase (beta-lactamase class C family)
MYKILSKLIVVLLSFILVISSTSLKVFAEGKKTPSGIEYSKLKDTIDIYAKQYIGNTTAAASVAVLQNDEILFKSNYGYGDIKNQIAVSDNTIYEWGSTSKLLIWVSAMQLEEQGKLNLNKDIKEYLPQNFFRKLRYDQPITMLNLMNHNAGFEEHLTDMFYKNPNDVKTLKETLEGFEPAQVYKPGEVVAYSNYGASLAAYIIERITGMEFYEYVNQNIFDVLNMKETSIQPLQKDNLYLQKNRPLTKGYVKNSKGFTERPILYLGIYPAGGAVGTLSDMCKFVSALVPKNRRKSLLFKNEKTFTTMFSESYKVTDDFPGICHGFWEHYYAVRTLEHGGNTDAFSSQITFALEEGLAVVIMTNQAHERSLCSGIKDKIFGSYKADKIESILPNSSAVEGKYRYMRRPLSEEASKWIL